MKKYLITGNIHYAIGIRVTVGADDDKTAQQIIASNLQEDKHPVDTSKLKLQGIEFLTIEEVVEN
jgi:hypothetical protein